MTKHQTPGAGSPDPWGDRAYAIEEALSLIDDVMQEEDALQAMHHLLVYALCSGAGDYVVKGVTHPERRCCGGPDGEWCGAIATHVCTLAPLQWFACAAHADSTEGASKVPIAEFFAQVIASLESPR